MLLTLFVLVRSVCNVCEIMSIRLHTSKHFCSEGKGRDRRPAGEAEPEMGRETGSPRPHRPFYY